MLAPGSVAIFVRMAFSRPTIYNNNKYAKDGMMSTRSDNQSISVAAGMTMKFVRRK